MELKPSTLTEELIKLPKEIRNLLAGGMAGMVAKSVVAPFDRIKILYQISSAEFHIQNVPKVALKIYRTEGLQALWKGNTATMIRVFPYSGIQFMIFDRCKTFLLREQEMEYIQLKSIDPTTPKPTWGLTPMQSLMSGMLAGASSVCVTYPLDLTRAQLAVLRRKNDAPNQRFYQVIAKNYTNRGLPGLFRGITPTMMGILPYSGIAYAVNEQTKRRIQNMTGRDVTTVERMVCGGLSGLIAQTIAYPLEVTRRRMQTIGIVPTSGTDAAVDSVGKGSSRAGAAEAAIRTVHPTKPPSMAAIVKELYAEQGIPGFFKGVTLNWFKGPIAFAISFTVFDSIQSTLSTESERKMRLP
eukprot:CAMPEP_0113619588 /NCGR_PEP_ID=MMETSP0017_2-20120614/9948_1 /TAXON_ID=2856 /ORGANISM="Cylindrotheca closterium" /LENGTH=354 /DNA_ID=CAMNT_0000529169 /DNA_START=169 /DNA_END=1229 /DNA_ORIENTATION=- /assembly_acc=CAM_ASM_000147